MRREAEPVAGLRQEMESYRNQQFTEWIEHGGDEASFRQQWPSMMRAYPDEKPSWKLRLKIAIPH